MDGFTTDSIFEYIIIYPVNDLVQVVRLFIFV